MSMSERSNPLPSNAAEYQSKPAQSSGKAGPWFKYPVRVQPHHTDYAGVVWHGAYVNWMEEARVECLRTYGLDYADLVALGCDLPVIDLSIRYRRALKMGMEAWVCTRMIQSRGARFHWDYEIRSKAHSNDGGVLHTAATVTLVPVSRETGAILRRLPKPLLQALQAYLHSATVPNADP